MTDNNCHSLATSISFNKHTQYGHAKMAYENHDIYYEF